jgi:hypothetical protein
MAAAIYSTTTQEGIDINSVFILDTSTPEYPNPPFLPGELAWGTDGSEFVYCTASITLAAGSVVIIAQTPGSWSVALIGGASVTAATNATGLLVGVVGGSQGSLVVPAPSGTQKGCYFWVQRAGNAQNVKTLATAVKLSQLHSSATLGGVLTSTGGGTNTTYQVNGIVITGANGSAAGPNAAVLNYPVVGATS